MKTHVQEQTLPYWHGRYSVRKFPKIMQDVDVDVCVVGGGIAGITTAYLLLQEGKSVCLLESLEIAGGQSGRTTAQFVTALDERYYEIERIHGVANAKLAGQSHAFAIELVAKIVARECIECEVERVNGYLFGHPGDTPQEIYDELEATQRAGLETEIVERAPLGSFDTGMALQFSNQLQLHPTKYIDGLAEKICERGGLIYAKSHVAEIRGGANAFVKTDEGRTVKAKNIVVATNSPINDVLALHTKQAAYRTYVIAYQIPKGSVFRALYWDTLDPYHYVRLESDSLFDYLIVGGEDHKTGQNDHPYDCFANLEEWTKVRFPMVQMPIYQWSGQVMEPVDGLAFLGRNPSDHENVFVITGDSGNGMTHSTIGATIITDLIMDRESPWTALYSPSRISFKTAGKFISENVNAAVQMGTWFTGDSYNVLDSLALGEGAVVRKGLQKVAAYKRLDGEFEFHSAACPHLGCVVKWNSAEKSWDCPCHGSRFDFHGKVIEGPSISDLKPIAIIEGDRARPLPAEIAGDLLIT
jgi:glycine/D-amino acid oxidase-like deaminating enzyme/nitrite reductase/ring-hydroxylating ferredoxin subunit